MLMPFGKYKGQDLSALSGDYLLWLIANIPLRSFAQCRKRRDHRTRLGIACTASSITSTSQVRTRSC